MRRGRSHDHHAVAAGSAHVSRADVLHDERRRPFPKPSHQGVGHVVPAVATIGISTRQDEECGRVRDHDMADMLCLGESRVASVLLDVEPQSSEGRNFRVQAPRLVLPPSPFGEPEERFARTTRHHEMASLLVGRRLRARYDARNVRVLARRSRSLGILGLTPLLALLGLDPLSLLAVALFLPLVDARIHPTFQLLVRDNPRRLPARTPNRAARPEPPVDALCSRGVGARKTPATPRRNEATAWGSIARRHGCASAVSRRIGPQPALSGLRSGAAQP